MPVKRCLRSRDEYVGGGGRRSGLDQQAVEQRQVATGQDLLAHRLRHHHGTKLGRLQTVALVSDLDKAGTAMVISGRISTKESTYYGLAA